MQEILRAIALFRLIVPDVPLRLAAGRESALTEFLSSAFLAGAAGMMIGGYLTQRGRSAETDLNFVRTMQELWGHDMNSRDWLAAQEQKDELRQLTPVKRLPAGQLLMQDQAGRPRSDFSSNDYLALSGHAELIEQSQRFLDKAGCGAGAARLMSGDLAMYHLLEAKTAQLTADKLQETTGRFRQPAQECDGVGSYLPSRPRRVWKGRV